MRVIFLCPQFPREMPEFVRGLSEVGAAVYGVGDTPAAQLSPGVARHLRGYLHVPNLMDDEAIVAEVKRWVGGATIDRVESQWEPLVTLAARLREEMGVPGMTRELVHYFRDKDDMKKKIAAAGLRVPHADRVRSVEEAREAARAIGFPLIIKPIAGAGSKDTHRVRDAEELEKVLPALRHVPEASVEEYIEGEEFTFDALTIDGRPVFYSVMQYHPKPLEARSTEWISPAQIVFADPDRVEKLRGGIELGKAVLGALEMETGLTHMEWFLTPKGEAVFGEIAGRMGGGGIADMVNWANEMDLYREWARAVCWKTFEGRPQRRYHVAMVFKRALGRGRITKITGRDEFKARHGAHVMADELLPVGAPRRDWLNTLVSDGWLAVRHANYDQCRAMMEEIIRDVKLYAA